ncbi:MAG: hypothetical protein KGH57_00255 [Candidatus Micrarchaeota archaeon]|nr:hypothetical protein [Candidatus Micrarchaeota archaeon]
MMAKIKNVFRRMKPSAIPAADDDRPIKFVRENENSWRIVYADANN